MMHSRWQQNNKYQSRDGIILQKYFSDAGQAAQHENEKIAYEKALAKTIYSGDDNGEPQPHHAQEKRCAECGKVERPDQAIHSLAPPI